MNVKELTIKLWFETFDTPEQIEQELDEFAKQQAIEFAEWLQGSKYFSVVTGWTTGEKLDAYTLKKITTDELYKIWEETK